LTRIELASESKDMITRLAASDKRVCLAQKRTWLIYPHITVNITVCKTSAIIAFYGTGLLNRRHQLVSRAIGVAASPTAVDIDSAVLSTPPAAMAFFPAASLVFAKKEGHGISDEMLP
jgi:hypothetical protein